MKREQHETWPLMLMLIHMQGCRRGSMVEHGNYSFENFRNQNRIGYEIGSGLATEMLNELGIPEIPLAIEVAADKVYDEIEKLNSLICDLSPVMQKQLEKVHEDIELGELIYFGDIVANIKPDWRKE